MSISLRQLTVALLASAAIGACTAGTDAPAETSGATETATTETVEEEEAVPSDGADRFVQIIEDQGESAGERAARPEQEQQPEAPVAAEPEPAAQPLAVGGLATTGAGVGGGGQGQAVGIGTRSASGRGFGAAVAREARVPSVNVPSGPPAEPVADREQFEDYGENDWTVAAEDALETFSIDVDTASYAIARRDLNSARLPRPESVRVEEFVNAFDYGYDGPSDLDTPFAVHVEGAPSRFGDGLDLLRVGIQGYETDPADRIPANLVFLVDTSGSMRSADKLGLVKYALGALLQSLGPDDTLSIVSYGGRAQVVLPTTRVEDRGAILDAINGLQAGGGTNGAEGIQTAYEVARAAFREGGTNRVIWCSDGDLNVGMTGDTLLEYIEENGRNGVALTTLGFGRGNYNDRDLERFANRGDGNYYYIDDRNEALRVLGDEVMSTLETIARDVKIQVEVNPAMVESYRLIGYENRAVADRDFRNDDVDAGEIGSGHSVTALMELQLRDDAVVTRNELLATVRVRYEMPGEEGEGREIEQTIYTHQLANRFEDASPGFRLAAGVAEFAEILRAGENAGDDFDAVLAVIEGARGDDLSTEELAALVTQARSIAN